MNNAVTIYLADDDYDDRTMMRDALTARIPNVKIIEAFDGQDLINKIETPVKPLSGIILTDLNMPRLNGFEVAKLIRSNSTYQGMPVIIVSSSSEQRMINEAYAMGVNRYIVKPVLWTDFLEIAESIHLCFNNFLR